MLLYPTEKLINILKSGTFCFNISKTGEEVFPWNMCPWLKQANINLID